MPPFVQQYWPFLALAVLVLIFWPQLESRFFPKPKRSCLPTPPQAPSPVDLSIMGWKAIRDAAEIKSAEIGVHRLGSYYAKKQFREAAEALNGDDFDPCDALNAIVRHANNCDESAKPATPK